jgi:uncharacterized protein with beta-barrel porin domain
VRVDRGRVRLLLASSSVAALLIGGGAPPALAATCTNTITATFDNPSGNTVANVCVQNTSFTGNITNEGTITPNGITFQNGTISGFISSTGIIAGGLSIDNQSKLSSTAVTVKITSPTFTGGISNAGTIATDPGASLLPVTAVLVQGVAAFAGGISNSGTISASRTSVGSGTAVTVLNVSTFTGGITNSGLISASIFSDNLAKGIRVENVGTFDGGIANGGTIAVAINLGHDGTGISVSNVSNFSGGISNGGTIATSAVTRGINITGVSTFTGGISNSGLVSGTFGAIVVGVVTTFAGGITNSGTISAGGVGIFDNAFTFMGGISNGGTISAGQAITIEGPTFLGGLTNSGLLSAASAAVRIEGVSDFHGGVANSGTISAFYGIRVDFSSNVQGGIANGGTISAGGVGILVSSIAVFGSTSAGGGITNSGTIASTLSHAVMVQKVSTFTGNITNSGTISSANQDGVFVSNVGTFAGDIVNSVSISAPALLANAVEVVAVTTFAGSISNSGTLSAAHNGIAILDGSIFTGSVTNSGTVTAGHNGIGVDGGGQLTFLGGITNSGLITAGFGIVVGGDGIVSFGGAVFNSAGGTIAATHTGILVAGVTTMTGGIVNNGTVTVGAGGTAGIFVTNVATFAGNISNAGSIVAPTGIKIGALVTFAAGAAVVNTGIITGTGGTAIDTTGASTPVTVTQAGGTINGAIRLSANADVLNVAGGTINGNIVGAGSSDTVNFNLGTGTFTLANTFNLTGVNALNVLSGTAILDGGGNTATGVTVSGGNLQIGDAANPGAKLTSLFVDVSDAGTLSGHGTVAASVLIDAGGTLAPGGSIGTLTISGSLVFLPGSFYGIALSPTQHSLTNVIGAPGTVQISGGTVVLTPQLGTYGATTFAILTSTGTLSGAFNPTIVQNGSTTLINPTLSYDAHDVFLSYGGGVNTLVVPPNGTINQNDVAAGINGFILGGGTMPAQFQGLAGLSGNGLLRALDTLSGEASTGAERGAFQLMDQFLALMLDPFVDGRIGPLGIGGTAPGFAPERQASFPPDVALAYASVLKAPPRPPTFDQRWTAWGAAFGGSNRTNGEGVVLGSHDVSTQAYGFAAGLDYRLDPDTVLGFALAGGGTGWSLAQALGGGSSDTFQTGIYGRTRSGNAYVATAADFGSFWMKTNRTAFAGDRLEATFNAQGYGARLESGYHVATPFIGVTPYAAVQALGFHSPSYAETDLGNGGFALAYNARTASDVRSELGARFDHLATFNGMPLTLRGRLAWAHDWVSDPSLAAVFLALPGSSFTVFGATPAKNSALTSAGAELRVTPTLSVSAKFDGQLAGGTQTYAGSGTVRLRW